MIEFYINNLSLLILSFFEDVTDPVGDVTRFIHSFEEILGTTHPTFYQGSYSQVSHCMLITFLNPIFDIIFLPRFESFKRHSLLVLY